MSKSKLVTDGPTDMVNYRDAIASKNIIGNSLLYLECEVLLHGGVGLAAGEVARLLLAA